jgi:hypothetical protein
LPNCRIREIERRKSNLAKYVKQLLDENATLTIMWQSWNAPLPRLHDLEYWRRVQPKNLDDWRYEDKHLILHALEASARVRKQDHAPRSRSPIDWKGLFRETNLVILARGAMAAAPRGVLMTIPVVVVPDGRDVFRVGFEEELWGGDDARRRGVTDGAGGRLGRCAHGALKVEMSATVRAGIAVFRHQPPRSCSRQ